MTDDFNKNERIGGHSFTVEWLLASLKENDSVFMENFGGKLVKNVEVDCISTGNGFLSKVFRCTFSFMGTSKTYSTLLKVPGIEAVQEARQKSEAINEEFSEEFLNRLVDFHDYECDFYRNLSSIADIPLPKVYKMQRWILGSQEGCLHMEDLSQISKCLGYFESANFSHVRTVIEHLAHLHKNFLCTAPEKWKCRSVKNQTWLADTIEGMNTEIEPFLRRCKREREFETLLEKLRPFFLNKTFYNYVTQDHCKDLGIAPVLLHADLYPSNILWHTDANGEVQNTVAAFIDWQLLCEGSPMADVARFLCQCTDGSVRRKAETFAVEYYLERLRLEFNNDASKVPYTYEQLKRSYQLCFLTQAFQTLGNTTFMTANTRISDPRIVEAHFDAGVLKALHAWQDCLWLLEGELNDVFEKYGK